MRINVYVSDDLVERFRPWRKDYSVSRLLQERILEICEQRERSWWENETTGGGGDAVQRS